jgi:DNA-binding NarL/FixJ family response regulator
MELRVVVVEDLQTMRGLLMELAELIGGIQVVATLSTEAEAKLWLEDHPGEWDLAIVDLVLEQGSGIGVLRRAKTDWPQGKVVVFSGYATPGVRQHCLDLGADAVFDKTESTPFIEWLRDQARGQP